MNAKKIKEELTKIFPGFIVAALVVWFDNSSSRWLYALLVFLTLYIILTICQNWDRICYSIKLKVYTILRKPLLKSVPSFCGREDVINEVYTQYWSAKGVRVVLICGLGGSGKTTVYKFFNKVLLNAPKTATFSEHLRAISVRNNSIIFADYAYENLSAIREFICKLKEAHKKRVLIVLLERTYAKEYFSVINYDHIIDLNSARYILDEKTISKIIEYNVSHFWQETTNQYIETGIGIDLQHSMQFANRITSEIDSQYHRPIFAVIIAELYRNDTNLDLNDTNSVNSLLERYWKQKTRYSTMQALIKATDTAFRAEKEWIIEAINNAKQLVELLTLFSSMSRLKIEIKNRNCIEVYSNEEQVNDEKLTDYISKYVSRMIDDEVKKHMVIKILGIDISRTYESVDYPHLVIEPNEFDIVSTWLLGKFYKESPEYTNQLGSIVSSVSSACIDKSIFSFVLRAIDEDNSDILIWYNKLKDCFINYNLWDFNEKLKELLERLNQAIANSQTKTKETIYQFLLDFIDTICEHIVDDEEISLLQNQMFLEMKNPGYSDEVKKVLKELINKMKMLSGTAEDAQLAPLQK